MKKRTIKKSTFVAFGFLLVPILMFAEAQLHGQFVRKNYLRLDKQGGYEEAHAVQTLVKGCVKKRRVSPYIRLLHGYCESLNGASLENANLSDKDLRFADLVKANLSHANLRYTDFRNVNGELIDFRKADLFGAKLHGAFLAGANLSYADLSLAQLRGTDLSGAILLATDLRGSAYLKYEQFAGDSHPYLCNTGLSERIGFDSNRDCEQLPQILVNRYNYSLEEAQKIVEDAKAKTWE